jgi:ribosomal-protein-alanine N-acetyltransferase
MLLETERLLLRPIQPSDISALVKLWSDPDVTRYMGGPRNTTSLMEQFEADLNNPSPEAFDLWPVVEKASGQLVGHCGLLPKEIDGKPEVELIYVFDASVWGKGYAAEMALALEKYAFEQMGLRRLVSLIDPQNEASERVALRAGMRLERETIRPGGKMMRVYAIQRQDSLSES